MCYVIATPLYFWSYVPIISYLSRSLLSGITPNQNKTVTLFWPHICHMQRPYFLAGSWNTTGEVISCAAWWSIKPFHPHWSTFPEAEIKERGKNDTPMFFPNAASFHKRGREMGRVKAIFRTTYLKPRWFPVELFCLANWWGRINRFQKLFWINPFKSF